jgi:hypothetical protein
LQYCYGKAKLGYRSLIVTGNSLFFSAARFFSYPILLSSGCLIL